MFEVNGKETCLPECLPGLVTPRASDVTRVVVFYRDRMKPRVLEKPDFVLSRRETWALAWYAARGCSNGTLKVPSHPIRIVKQLVEMEPRRPAAIVQFSCDATG
jgi:hypothetical protein